MLLTVGRCDEVDVTGGLELRGFEACVGGGRSGVFDVPALEFAY